MAEFENQEIENEDYSDEPNSETLESWDPDTHPDDVADWDSQDDYDQAKEYYADLHPPKHDGESYPDPMKYDWESEAEQEAELEKWKVRQAADEMGKAQAKAAEKAAREHPAEVDKDWGKKGHLIEKVHEYAAKADAAKRAGDGKEAEDYEGHMRVYASELADLDKPRQDAESAAQRKAEAADRKFYLDQWDKNPKAWDQEVTRVGSDRMAENAEVYCIQEAENSDSNTLYMVVGHSNKGFDGDPKLFKIDVPASVKQEILSRLSWNDGITMYDAAKEHPSLGSQIPDAVEVPDIDFDDDEQLKALTMQQASKLAPSQFEKWRILNGGRQPKYISPLAGIAQEPPK